MHRIRGPSPMMFYGLHGGTWLAWTPRLCDPWGEPSSLTKGWLPDQRAPRVRCCIPTKCSWDKAVCHLGSRTGCPVAPCCVVESLTISESTQGPVVWVVNRPTWRGERHQKRSLFWVPSLKFASMRNTPEKWPTWRGAILCERHKS